VHKDTIAVALASAGKRGEVCAYGSIANTPAALKGLASRLAKSGTALRFCYEAGPCGYGIQRQLGAAGHDCVVVAPSLIPRTAQTSVRPPTRTSRRRPAAAWR
jgi:transposase